MDTTNIREHMEVVGSDGGHVGVVDSVDAASIKLTRNDATSGGTHRHIPLVRVDRVEDRVILDRPAGEVTATWSTASSRDAGLVDADDEVADGARTAGRAQAVPTTQPSPDAGSQ